MDISGQKRPAIKDQKPPKPYSFHLQMRLILQGMVMLSSVRDAFKSD